MADELALHHGAITPKRKRHDGPTGLSPEESAVPKFSFRSGDDDGNGTQSPRSSMAHQFRGLALESESGGGVPAGDAGEPASSAPAPTPLATVDSNDNSDNNNVNKNSTITATLNDSDTDSADDKMGSNINGLAMRKRLRSAAKAGNSTEGAPTANPEETSQQATPSASPSSPTPVPTPVVDIPNIATKQVTNRRPSLQRSLPSINRLTTVKPRTQTPTPPEDTVPSFVASTETEGPKPTSRGSKKRSETPPLKLRSKPAGISPPSSPEDSSEEEDYEEAARIVDPLRASLTWHEDEITVYDPDDSEDDGEGIEGIGFKPSQIVADARAAKRRQQLLEYRRREENDARDRRSQRRRAAAAAVAAVANVAPVQTLDMMSGDESRKVRFMDIEPVCVVTTS